MSRDNDILDYSSQGQVWAVAATGAITGKFKVIQIVDDGTTFSDLTMLDSTNIALAEAATYNKGEYIYGRCTGFTVSAGRVCAHKYSD